MKIVFFTLLIAMIVMVSGCQLIGPKRERGIPDMAAIIYKGTEGIVPEFAENAPPEDVLREYPFLAVVMLRNKGAVDVKKDEGWLTVTVERPKLNLPSVTDSSIKEFSVLDKGKVVGKYIKFPEDLTGKETDLTGSIIGIQFDIMPGKSKEVSKTTASIIATVCYNYKTKLSANVCIDTEPYRPGKKDKPCKMELIELQSQGAPIAITRIEPAVRLAEDNKIVPRFKIFIENVGRGIVMNKADTKKACDGTLLTDSSVELSELFGLNDHSDASSAEIERIFNKVSVAPDTLKLGNSKVKCTSNSITLKKDTARNYFICNAEPYEQGQGSFVTSLNLTLEYGYTEIKSKIVTIEEELK